MGGRLSNNGNNYGSLIRPTLSNPKKIASNSGKNRVKFGKIALLCEFNEKYTPFCFKNIFGDSNSP
jgi:hypothetical protein